MELLIHIQTFFFFFLGGGGGGVEGVYIIPMVHRPTIRLPQMWYICNQYIQIEQQNNNTNTTFAPQCYQSHLASVTGWPDDAFVLPNFPRSRSGIATGEASSHPMNWNVCSEHHFRWNITDKQTCGYNNDIGIYVLNVSKMLRCLWKLTTCHEKLQIWISAALRRHFECFEGLLAGRDWPAENYPVRTSRVMRKAGAARRRLAEKLILG